MGKTPAPEAVLGLPLPVLNPRDSPNTAEQWGPRGSILLLPFLPMPRTPFLVPPQPRLPHCPIPINLPPPPPKERGRSFGQRTANCLGTSFYKKSLRSWNLDWGLSKHTYSWSCPLGGFLVFSLSEMKHILESLLRARPSARRRAPKMLRVC